MGHAYMLRTATVALVAALVAGCATGPTQEQVAALATACNAGKQAACITLNNLQQAQIARSAALSQSLQAFGTSMLLSGTNSLSGGPHAPVRTCTWTTNALGGSANCF